jgi:hypothetical protein
MLSASKYLQYLVEDKQMQILPLRSARGQDDRRDRLSRSLLDSHAVCMDNSQDCNSMERRDRADETPKRSELK